MEFGDSRESSHNISFFFTLKKRGSIVLWPANWFREWTDFIFGSLAISSHITQSSPGWMSWLGLGLGETLRSFLSGFQLPEGNHSIPGGRPCTVLDVSICNVCTECEKSFNGCMFGKSGTSKPSTLSLLKWSALVLVIFWGSQMQDVFQNCFIVLSKRVASAGPIAKHVRLKVKHLCKAKSIEKIFHLFQRKSQFFWNRWLFLGNSYNSSSVVAKIIPWNVGKVSRASALCKRSAP